MGVCSSNNANQKAEKKAAQSRKSQNSINELEAQIEALKKMQEKQIADVQQEQGKVMRSVLDGGDASHMWSLLAKSVVSGIHVSKDQLDVLWNKYDQDKNGILDMNEVKCILNDVNLSKIELLEQALAPDSAFRETNKKNPMADFAEIEMKNKLYALQQQVTDGVNDTELHNIFSQLDDNGDGQIQKTEFFTKAEDVMFSEQTQARDVVQTLMSALEVMQKSLAFDVSTLNTKFK